VRDTLGLAAEPLADVLVALDRARYAASPGEGHRETDTAPVWKRRFDRAWRDYRPPVNARSPGAADMRPLAGALIALSLAWGADSGAQANAATRTESASSPPARARAQDKAQKPRVLKRKTASSAPASAQRASAARPARPPARATGAEDVPLAYGRRADILQFAAEVAQRRGMDASALEKHLAQAQRLPTVQRLIMPPPAGTAKDWAAYRARFVEPRRIEAGLRFWRQHENWLELAEARWGVPASLIVGIIGVETLYGRHTGNFRVIDALATLTFDFPPGRRDRSAFFRDELEELFAWAQRQGVDPSAIKGSYAGAVGLPQFMPGSINRWAVDFDEDGRIDLQGSAADAIGSVAHYLAGFGWQRDMPTHFSVAAPVEVADRVTLLGPDILPTFTAAEFAARGAMLPPEAQAHDGPLALVELQNGEAAPSYVAGTRNFYAVTRYNWSSYYAMAVIELGQAVRSAVRRQEGTTPPSAPGSRD
jgi:membrane-bound lytic murein transglycosylase B